jgi:hypothetical protein
MEAAREQALAFIEGKRRDDLIQIGHDIVVEVIGPRIYPGCAGDRRPPRRGDRTYLVTAAPQELAQGIATYLGMDGASGPRPSWSTAPTPAGCSGRCCTGRPSSTRSSGWPPSRGSTCGQQRLLGLGERPAAAGGVGRPVAVNPDRTCATWPPSGAGRCRTSAGGAGCGWSGCPPGWPPGHHRHGRGHRPRLARRKRAERRRRAHAGAPTLGRVAGGRPPSLSTAATSSSDRPRVARARRRRRAASAGEVQPSRRGRARARPRAGRRRTPWRSPRSRSGRPPARRPARAPGLAVLEDVLQVLAQQAPAEEVVLLAVGAGDDHPRKPRCSRPIGTRPGRPGRPGARHAPRRRWARGRVVLRLERVEGVGHGHLGSSG